MVAACPDQTSILHTHFGIESIARIAGKIWNKIPNEIKEASSLTVFKSKIKTFSWCKPLKKTIKITNFEEKIQWQIKK